jgi:hypothetical protein
MHNDLMQLRDHLLSMAQDLLAKDGKFIPFAGWIDRNGELTTALTTPMRGNIIDALTLGLQQQAVEGCIRAAGICFDAEVMLSDGKKNPLCAYNWSPPTANALPFTYPTRKPGWEG